MKNLLIIPLLIFLALSEALIDSMQHSSKLSSVRQINNTNKTKATALVNSPAISTYNFQIAYKSSERNLQVKQKILWRNLTSKKTNIIYLGLPANSFLNGNSIYFVSQEFDEKWESGYEFGEIKEGKNNSSIKYTEHKIYKGDKSLGFIELNKTIFPGDSVEIVLNYKMKIPQGTENFGYSKGGNFCLLANWHPYIIQFHDGKWLSSHRSKIYKPKSENSEFYATLMVDDKLQIASSAEEINNSSLNNSQSILFKQDKGDALVFAFYSDVHKTELKYINESGSEIDIPICLLPENERYRPRIESIVTNTLDYLTQHFGFYPFRKLSLVNVPDNTNFGFKSYASLITFYCDLFSPKAIQKPENDIARMICKQYFQNYINIYSVEDKWIEEGIPTYLSSKVMEKYYGRPLINFYLASYVPIYGLNLLSYNEIPIIYTLNEFYYSPKHRDVPQYYKYIDSNPITDSTHFLDSENYKANLSIKPALIINSVDNSIGENLVIKSIRDLFVFRTNQSLTRSFINSFAKNNSSELIKFLEDGFYGTENYDYAITGLSAVNNTVYNLELARYGSGVSSSRIYLYTEKDTLTAEWDGKNKKQIIQFVTANRVIAAEIKPHFSILMDSNYSNNSYTVDQKYWGSLSIAIRSFFWFQNALMIFGSIG